MSTDLYDTLGVSRDADGDAIKKAYRKLARQLHPDVNPDPATQERFKDVSHAYEVLSDPEKRRMYDLGGDPFSAGGFGGAGAGAGFSFTDIMDAFFGGNGAGAAQGAGGRGPRPRVRRGQDALIRLDVDLAEAAFGTTHELKVDTAVLCTTCHGDGAAPGSSPKPCETCGGRGETIAVQRSFLGEIRTMRPCAACRGFGSIIPEPCRECSGDGRVRSRRTLTVKIPAGVDTGTRVQLSGQGEVGPGGGPAGDLYVEMHVNEHPMFTRHGADLLCSVTLPMTAAALGTTIDLPTLEADVVSRDDSDVETSFPLEIRPGTQSGTETVLGGRGIPSLRGGGRGDLVVRIVVETPTRLDARQEALLTELAALRDEASPSGRMHAPSKGVFNRLREAFNPPMSLPLFVHPGLASVSTGETVEMGGEEARHAVVVKRIRVGEQVALTDGSGATATVTVTATSAGSLAAVVDSLVTTAPEMPRVVVVQAIPKGDRGELAVEMLTEVGVDVIVPWAADRSVPVWRAEKRDRALAKWRSTAREAAKQARRSWFPEVADMVTTPQVVGLLRDASVPVVLHEAASGPLADLPVPGRGEIVIVVGPEGGISDEELAAFAAVGAEPVRMGTSVLRTSTAGVAATAALLARTRWR